MDEMRYKTKTREREVEEEGDKEIGKEEKQVVIHTTFNITKHLLTSIGQ